MKFLFVLLLLCGIIALILRPQVQTNMERTYAEDAIATVKMVGTTNRMYSLDYHGQWANGTVDNACNSAQCDASGRTAGAPACNLVACNYLAHQDWDSKRYIFYALDGSSPAAGNNACGNFPAAKIWVACAVRKSPADGDRSAPKQTAGWAYGVAADGAVVPALPPGGSLPVPGPETP